MPYTNRSIRNMERGRLARRLVIRSAGIPPAETARASVPLLCEQCLRELTRYPAHCSQSSGTRNTDYVSGIPAIVKHTI
jgi:hypothetical protein